MRKRFQKVPSLIDPHLYGPWGFHNVGTQCGFFGYNSMVMDYILLIHINNKDIISA